MNLFSLIAPARNRPVGRTSCPSRPLGGPLGLGSGTDKMSVLRNKAPDVFASSRSDRRVLCALSLLMVLWAPVVSGPTTEAMSGLQPR